jgi:nitrate reductase NapE
LSGDRNLADRNNKSLHGEIDMESPENVVPEEVRSREKRMFLFLTVVLAPMVAVAVVGSYGLLIWLYQMFMGPPKG